MRYAIGLVLATILACSAANAQAPHVYFSQQEGHWTIMSTERRCYAVNRPLYEANATPFNMLILSLTRGGGITLTANFWPGHVQAAASRLALWPQGRPQVTLSAKPVADYGLETTEPLSSGLVQDLRTAGLLDVDIPGVRHGLTFDIERLGFVIARLETCARLLP